MLMRMLTMMTMTMTMTMNRQHIIAVAGGCNARGSKANGPEANPVKVPAGEHASLSRRAQKV